ncbi:MAG: hypothetical protein SV253_08175 [Halobacteria archaeon]|nr:hypothetical protein [Halobacteria archaeon]
MPVPPPPSSFVHSTVPTLGAFSAENVESLFPNSFQSSAATGVDATTTKTTTVIAIVRLFNLIVILLRPEEDVVESRIVVDDERSRSRSISPFCSSL